MVGIIFNLCLKKEINLYIYIHMFLVFTRENFMKFQWLKNYFLFRLSNGAQKFAIDPRPLIAIKEII